MESIMWPAKIMASPGDAAKHSHVSPDDTIRLWSKSGWSRYLLYYPPENFGQSFAWPVRTISRAISFPSTKHVATSRPRFVRSDRPSQGVPPPTGVHAIVLPSVLVQEPLFVGLWGDAEKTEQAIPPDNTDVSRVYGTNSMSRKVSLDSTYRMMRFVDWFETVNTNRLHIGILGAILGKRVNVYDNSYGKNRAVFDHSIAGRFANVVWCD